MARRSPEWRSDSDPALVEVGKRLVTNLRRQRAAAGVTQEELAERVGCDPRWIRTLEQRPANTSLRMLVVVARALGTDVTALLAPAPPSPKRSPGRPRKPTPSTPPDAGL